MATILIIDDSRSTLVVMESMLTEVGHRVISRLTAAGVVELASAEAADLIITDIFMPDEDGFEVISKLRKMRPRIPVIAISGSSRIKNILEISKHLGADSSIRKPFSREQLLKTVDDLLASRLTPGPALGGANLG